MFQMAFFYTQSKATPCLITLQNGVVILKFK